METQGVLLKGVAQLPSNCGVIVVESAANNLTPTFPFSLVSVLMAIPDIRSTPSNGSWWPPVWVRGSDRTLSAALLCATSPKKLDGQLPGCAANAQSRPLADMRAAKNSPCRRPV